MTGLASEDHQAAKVVNQVVGCKSLVFGRDFLLSEAVRDCSGKMDQANEATRFVVMGEVNCPGEFELKGEVNVVSALLAAGGPSRNASLRRLEVRLDDQLLAEFDLYDYIIKGNLNNNFVFNGGESVVVPSAGPMLKACGDLLRTGVFELKLGEMVLDKFLHLCGGLATGESGCRIEILREIGGYKRVFLAIELEGDEPVPSVSLLPGDEVFVKNRMEERLTLSLEGSVNGGELAYRDGMRLSDVLSRSGILRPVTSLEYAEVLREGGSGDLYEVLGFVPRNLISGDLVGDFSLRPSDRIIFFSQEFLSRNPIVFVEGLVKNPGRQPLVREADIIKMIDMADGLSGDLEQLEGELSRREIKDGKLLFSQTKINIGAAVRGDPRHNLKLKPFDSLRIFKP